MNSLGLLQVVKDNHKSPSPPRYSSSFPKIQLQHLALLLVSLSHQFSGMFKLELWYLQPTMLYSNAKLLPSTDLVLSTIHTLSFLGLGMVKAITEINECCQVWEGEFS